MTRIWTDNQFFSRTRKETTTIPSYHVSKDSKIGVEEIMVLSSTFLRLIDHQQVVSEVVTSEKLNMILERTIEI